MKDPNAYIHVKSGQSVLAFQYRADRDDMPVPGDRVETRGGTRYFLTPHGVRISLHDGDWVIYQPAQHSLQSVWDDESFRAAFVKE